MIRPYINLFLFVLASFPLSAHGDQMTFKFKSPSFSGENQSGHYLTIENQEHTRREALEQEIEALRDELEREEDNTTLARFLRNFESRVYAQLSRQLVDQLFGEHPQMQGFIELLDNSIEYEVIGDEITLRITSSDGNVTTITIPVGQFTF